MITDKTLESDKAKLLENIISIENALNQKQQEIQILQTTLIKYNGALSYIQDNLKPKEGEK